MLTGKELYESGMITGALESNVQQQGIDVRISKVSKLSGMGIIPETGKTSLPEYTEIKPLRFHNKKIEQYITGWMLPAGVYEIEFMEGVNVGNSFCMKPLTRSSLVRCGARVDSGLYDAGFHTENAGAMLYVTNTILIEKGSRIAQIVCMESNEVNNLYNGQFQNDKQRQK